MRPRRLSGTAVRLGAAFATVLALFATALLVTLATLDRITQAEADVAELDHAKHSGHLVAAQVREQYIHQAHTLINWDFSHLDHYDAVVRSARAWADRLRRLCRTEDEMERAEEIVLLLGRSDEQFRREVLTAIERDDRAAFRGLHSRTEAVVNRVLRLTEEINDSFERRSAEAREHAGALRGRARTATLLCFGLAIVIAAVLGLLITRAIVRPMMALREGALRVARGERQVRVEVPGRDEFADLAATFNHMTAELAQHQERLVRVEKLASIGQLAAGVAHEINNPLGVILGYVKLLRREAEGEAADWLQTIEDEAHQCQRIVQDLLDLARSQRLDLAEVDLADLARDAVDRLEETDRLNGVTVHRPADGDRAPCRGDEQRLRQVLGNLLRNAVEAARTDGSVVIEVSHVEDDAVLTVADDGPGIAPEMRARVFEPFFTTKSEGTGLGLAISQAIVDAHGGRIEIDDTPGGGARVRICLPIAGPREEPPS